MLFRSNAGAVTGSENVGGLIGHFAGGDVYYCYNAGAVALTEGSETEYLGTMIGRLSGNLGFKGDYVLSTPIIGGISSSSLEYINKKKLIQSIDLTTLRLLPEGLNVENAYVVDPGKTPALKWQAVAGCTHPAAKQEYRYVPVPVSYTHLSLILIGFFIFFPLLWLINTALKPTSETFSSYFFVGPLTLDRCV